MNPHHSQHDRRATPDASTDPVCGMTVDPVTAPRRHTAGGGAAYFCSTGCAAAFDDDPGRYITAGPVTPTAGGAR